MQRLAEKIYREFSSSCKYVEILVLDGNGGIVSRLLQSMHFDVLICQNFDNFI